MSNGAAGAAGAAEYIGLHYTTPPWSSRASLPVTHALGVVLNRRAVRLLPCVCLCFFSSLSILVCRLIFFFTMLLHPRLHLQACTHLNSTYEDCWGA